MKGRISLIGEITYTHVLMTALPESFPVLSPRAFHAFLGNNPDDPTGYEKPVAAQAAVWTDDAWDCLRSFFCHRDAGDW